MDTYGAPHVMQEELKDFEHDWESHLLLREADAKGAAATPMAAPASCLDAVPDVPAMREEDEQLLLPGTTWPFTGPRWSDTDNAVCLRYGEPALQRLHLRRLPAVLLGRH